MFFAMIFATTKQAWMPIVAPLVPALAPLVPTGNPHELDVGHTS